MIRLPRCPCASRAGRLLRLILLPVLLLSIGGCLQTTSDPTATPIPPTILPFVIVPPTARPTPLPTAPPPTPTLPDTPTTAPATATAEPSATDTPVAITGPHMGRAPIVPVLAYHL